MNEARRTSLADLSAAAVASIQKERDSLKAEVKRLRKLLGAVASNMDDIEGNEFFADRFSRPLRDMLYEHEKYFDIKWIRSLSTKGTPQGKCESTLTERFANPDCACDTYPGNLGPCKTFEAGPQGACVYCDHSEQCHQTLKVRIERPVFAFFVAAVTLGFLYWTV